MSIKKQMFYVILLVLTIVSCQNQRESSSTISVKLFDEQNKLTAARVRFTDMEGNYIAPINQQADFPVTNANIPESKEQGAVMDNDRRFAYVDEQFDITLPVDSVRIEVVKGFHYKIYDDTLAISQVGEKLDIQLKKWFKPPEDNWFTGDVHVHHIDPEMALLEMKAEDVNVCNLLISDFTTDHENFRGEIEPESDPEHIIYYGQEYREYNLGHVNLLNLKGKLIEPSKGDRGYQYPLNLSASDEVRKNNGHISWAHFAAWPGLEGPLALVLKKVDAVELLCTIDPFHEPIFASDVVPEIKMNSGLRLWYRLLNCGLNIPLSAGTDKMNNQVTVEANRVYAQVEEDFTYDNWINAINQGKTFISNSPFISFKVDDQGPGSIIDASGKRSYKITVEVWSQFPIDRLEIVVNGELLAEKAIAAGESHAQLEATYSTEKSVWLAARAYQFSRQYTKEGLSLSQRRDAGGGSTIFNQYFGTLRPETIFAHTSPVYLMVDDQPVKSLADANYFVRYLDNSIKWLEESGSFPSETAKQEVLNTFREGREVFAELGR
ncbi:CehA/McbA family metallohydrolase [Reichenbachiella sp. MALMAid0571]|uniref:CehA/McbA family metallohydrolase n=1 Tax=Reichenbachiella sp. MALMAid0571 TaxID=3143939 RepID=UPI0032DE5E1A